MTETTFRKPFLPPDRSAVAAEWKRSFIRSTTVATLARLRKTDAGEVEREMRGAVVPMRASDYPGGSVAKLLLLAPRSLAAQIVPLAMTVDLKGVSSFNCFPLASNFASAAFVLEGAAIPLRQGAFTGLPVGPIKKLALLGALSAELEAASGDIASTAIGYTIEVMVGRGLDGKLVSADPETPEAPAGLLHNIVPLPGGSDLTKDLSALVASISAAGLDASASSTIFVTSASAALTIKLTAGPLFDYRVIASNAVPDGTIIGICAPALVFVGDGANPVIDTSRQATLHFSDTPSQIATVGSPPVVSAPTQNLFQNDLIALRCIARVSWSCAPGAISVVENATWGRAAKSQPEQQGSERNG